MGIGRVKKNNKINLITHSEPDRSDLWSLSLCSAVRDAE